MSISTAAPDGYTIRPATPGDAGDIARLIDGLADYEKLAHESNPDPDALRRHLEPDSQPRCEALVAHDTHTGRCVGFALYFHNYSTFLTRFGIYLEDLFVEPDYRGRGIGLGLLRTLCSVAVDRGCERVDWSVLDWNEPAIGFYERLGARPLSDWTTMRLEGERISRVARGDTSVTDSERRSDPDS